MAAFMAMVARQGQCWSIAPKYCATSSGTNLPKQALQQASAQQFPDCRRAIALVMRRRRYTRDHWSLSEKTRAITEHTFQSATEWFAIDSQYFQQCASLDVHGQCFGALMDALIHNG